MLRTAATAALSTALFLCGVVLLWLLPNAPLIAQDLYTDENALLPGAALSQLPPDTVERASTLAARAAAAATELPRGSVRSLILSEMRAAGLIAEPCGELIAFGVLAAPKADGKEALALVCDFDSNPGRATVHGGGGVPSWALALALVASLSEAGRGFLAKDIVLIAVDRAQDEGPAQRALDNWVDAYFGLTDSGGSGDIARCAPGIDAGSGRGAIIGAVGLESGGAPLSGHWTLLASGLQGRLPNLDLVNLVLRLWMQHGLPISISDTRNWGRAGGGTSTPVLSSSHVALLRFSTDLALGASPAYHGAFLRCGVDALTLRSVPRGGPASVGSLELWQTARALEGSLRSLNNLVERLHHSTFFYLLFDLAHFTSMNRFLYAVPLLIGPLLVRALVLLFSASSDSPASPSILAGAALHAAFIASGAALGALHLARPPAASWTLSVAAVVMLIALLRTMAGVSPAVHRVHAAVTLMTASSAWILLSVSNFPLAAGLALLACPPLWLASLAVSSDGARSKTALLCSRALGATALAALATASPWTVATAVDTLAEARGFFLAAGLERAPLLAASYLVLWPAWAAALAWAAAAIRT
jgi:hypothetical protein